MTVAKDDKAAPVGYGIYDNMAAALYGMNCIGVHPGFCESHDFYNPDGSKSGTLMAQDGVSIILTKMPLKTALRLVKPQNAMCDVPDYYYEEV